MEHDQKEPIIRHRLGGAAITSALYTCWLVNTQGEFWVPRFFHGDDLGHQAIFDYMTAYDWKFQEESTDGNRNFADLDHCLLALAFAATLAGVSTEEVIQ
jgi:hypothetical protein